MVIGIAGEAENRLKVSGHAIKRYRERINPLEGGGDHEVSGLIVQRLQRAVFLYEGTIGNHGDGQFFLDDDLVFIVRDDTVITLYPAEYNFSPEIDAMIRAHLVQTIVDIRGQIGRAEEDIRKTQSATELQRTLLEQEAEYHRAELARIETAIEACRGRVREVQAVKASLELHWQTTAAKLVHSRNYSAEMLAATIGAKVTAVPRRVG